MAQQRYRLMYKFWLNVNKPEEEALADDIELLKNERSFTKTIREGIRLICELRDGKLDFLLALFPFVVDLIFERFFRSEIEREWQKIEHERQRLAHEFAVLEEEKRLLQAEKEQQGGASDSMSEQLERIERMLLEQGNQPIQRTAERPSRHQSGEKPKITVTENDGTGGASDEEIMENIMNLAKMFG